ncbi:hypothetical protein Q4E93_27885 [Flavitalea sp. BT771]|uniref:hypothetical protein n=1 Tax=Flavitalea sp. BT771 TaxID=3063329 RepID=UPI0026E41CF8|nr:hypothetical protein [Flavitalea sp. BT771]MDO6434464.1 hypothetical protein [Flavitalea sp. BT771]MDV6223364.1 hypothetical protein [Flavitalea sp. BT771]
MRYTEALRIVAFASLLISCRKDHPNNPPPTDPVKKILLKDITIPHIPSPYYHFEYNPDSTVSKADFASGYTIYDVIYAGNRIAEMRNNILVNHDTLRYLYDNAGKVFMIKFINQQNVLYRHVTFAYNGDKVTRIEWDHKEGDAGFLIDRTLTFTYLPDGNVSTITEHRPAHPGSPELTSIRQFGQYDNKINVEDFSLIHDGIHDHLFLLQGFRLQKNNPGKESFSAGVGLTAYTIDYTYTYNSDNTPSSKIGELLYTDGSDAGKRFQTHAAYTYY